MAPGGGDVDDEARGVRLGELGMAQLLGQGPRLLLVEAVVVELDLLVGRGAHDEEIAGRLHRTGGPSGDAGQQLAQVLTRDQLGGGGVDLLQALGGPPELVLQGLDRRLAPLGPGRRRLPRRGGAVGGEARALAPDQPVAAALRPPSLALLLDDRAASESQDGGDLAEEALGEGAERRAPRRAAPGGHLHHHPLVAALGHHHRGDGHEAGTLGRQPTQQVGRAHALSVGGPLVLAHNGRAHVPADLGVAQHPAGRAEQGHRRRVGAPGRGVLEVGDRALLAGGRQHCGHSLVSGTVAHVAQGDAGDHPRDVPLGGRSLLHVAAQATTSRWLGAGASDRWYRPRVSRWVRVRIGRPPRAAVRRGARPAPRRTAVGPGRHGPARACGAPFGPARGDR